MYLWEVEGRMGNSSLLRGPEVPSQHCASCNLQEELEKAPRFPRGKGFCAYLRVLGLFFFFPVFLLPFVWFGNGRPRFPESGWRLAGPQHHWRSKRKTLGKYVLRAGGKGGRGAGRPGDILRLPVSLELNEHGVNMPPSQGRKRTKKFTAVFMSSLPGSSTDMQ